MQKKDQKFSHWVEVTFLCCTQCSSLCRLYKERLSQVDIKLQEVMAGCAQEYLEPLANLQENMQIRTKVAGVSIKYFSFSFSFIFVNINNDAIKKWLK